MGGEWELHGTYNGFATDLHGKYIGPATEMKGEENTGCEKMIKNGEMGKMCGKLVIKKDLQELK